jgi:hypothetical protein
MSTEAIERAGVARTPTEAEGAGVATGSIIPSTEAALHTGIGERQIDSAGGVRESGGARADWAAATGLAGEAA